MKLHLRLFIALASAISANECAASTMAVAGASCVTASQAQSSAVTASAFCFSNTAIIYSASASASAFTASTSASTSASSFTIGASAGALYEGDFLITFLGGTGPGFYMPGFSYSVIVDNFSDARISASFNGLTQLLDTSMSGPSIGPGMFSMVYGQPLFLHIALSSSAATHGPGGATSASSFVTLIGFTGFSGGCPRVDCVVTSQFTLVEAPEPATALPVLGALVIGLVWAVGLRRAVKER